MRDRGIDLEMFQSKHMKQQPIRKPFCNELFHCFFLATTRRVRPVQQDTKNTRKRHQQTTTRRRNSTVQRRGSQYQEVQVAMLPDLSQDLTDEERIWEEIHEIKTMPVSMAQKKEMKAQLQVCTCFSLQLVIIFN